MLKVALVFNDNMVLQMGKTIKVWGSDTPSNNIVVSILENTKSVVVDTDGNWLVELPAISSVYRNIELKVSNDNEIIAFKNVCIGEVWIASGQSNMEYYLNFDCNGETEINKPQNFDIRFFDYPKVSYEGQIDEHDYSEFGHWRLPTKEDLPYFSAVAFYFAKNLHLSMDVPIGIIGCSWGGTPACTWLDPSYLENNEGNIWLKEYEESVKGLDIEKYISDFKNDPRTNRTQPFLDELGCKLMYPGLTVEEQENFSENTEPLPMGSLDERRPGGLYETMIKNIYPISFKGVIWYQGESDDKHSNVYRSVFGNLIKCWRELWGEDFPFLFVQLAPFEKWLHVTEKNFVNLRIEQEVVSKTVPNVYMASSSDCGMRYDIHPKNKKPIGERLGLLARKHVYNQAIIGSAPELQSVIREGNEICIKFENAKGLHFIGEKINALRVASNQKFIEFDAQIKDDSVIIKGDFSDTVEVAFAMTNYYEVNLYNVENNPAKPFRVIV